MVCVGLVGLLGWLGTLVIPLLIFTWEPPPSNYCDTNTKNVDFTESPRFFHKKPRNNKKIPRKSRKLKEISPRFSFPWEMHFFPLVLLAAAAPGELGGISDYSSSPRALLCLPCPAFPFFAKSISSSWYFFGLGWEGERERRLIRSPQIRALHFFTPIPLRGQRCRKNLSLKTKIFFTSSKIASLVPQRARFTPDGWVLFIFAHSKKFSTNFRKSKKLNYRPFWSIVKLFSFEKASFTPGKGPQPLIKVFVS